MPSSKIHVLGGLAVFCLLTKILHNTFLFMHVSWYHYILLFGVTLLGSIFPDIDIASNMQKIFFSSMFLLLPILLLMKYIFIFFIFVAISLLFLLIKHRTLTHRTWFLFSFSGSLFIVSCFKSSNNISIAFVIFLYFFIGSISHLVLDYGFKRFFLKK